MQESLFPQFSDFRCHEKVKKIRRLEGPCPVLEEVSVPTEFNSATDSGGMVWLSIDGTSQSDKET